MEHFTSRAVSETQKEKDLKALLDRVLSKGGYKIVKMKDEFKARSGKFRSRQDDGK